MYLATLESMNDTMRNKGASNIFPAEILLLISLTTSLFFLTRPTDVTQEYLSYPILYWTEELTLTFIRV